MPLFEIGESELIPFRRVPAGPELYESKIEELLWDNLEGFVGKPLFPVARQPQIGGGLRPDILALDQQGQPVVIEVKRDIDRKQLAQCLEYAGWARQTALDEMANLFHGGAQAFFPEWMDFTETATPILLRPTPALVLVARDFDTRTESALSFLTENGVPVTVLRVTLYMDRQGREFIDVEGEHEPDVAIPAPPTDAISPKQYKIDGRRIEVSDLLDAELVHVGDALSWTRPRLGDTYHATITIAGDVELADGRVFSSPSRAAKEAAGRVAVDGWHAWKMVDGRALSDIRDKLLAKEAQQ